MTNPEARTAPHYNDDLVTLHHGDCLEVLQSLPDNSVDAVVTDPPYGLGFMGKAWDDAAALASRPPSAEKHDNACPKTGKGPKAVTFDGVAFQQWCALWTTECLRILKPGGHLLAFGGTRTWHRLACAVEDAGFEIRDSIAWLYGSGFPKSLDVSKAIDKAAGAERPVIGERKLTGTARIIGGQGSATAGRAAEMYESHDTRETLELTGPATPDAARWQGWGTALKPAHEPCVVARKPLIGTVAANVLTHGTGALNIDGCRVGFASAADEQESKAKNQHADFGTEAGGNAVYGDFSMVPPKNYNPPGRWPANVVLNEDAAAELDAQSGTLHSQDPATRKSKSKRQGVTTMGTGESVEYADKGGASRFFYCAKAPTLERPRDDNTAHPTVKPLDLMRWLVRLITPPGGVVLDPFAGSGTTAEACVIESFRCIAIEREATYLPLITQRLTKPIQQDMFGGTT